MNHNIQIEYLSPQDAYGYFRSAPHMAQMNDREAAYRANLKITGSCNCTKSYMKYYYKTKLREFNTSEIQVLSWLVNVTVPILSSRSRKLIPEKIRFAKLESGVDWDFPFTLHKKTDIRDGCIVFTEKYLEQLILDKNQGRNLKEMQNTLVHEMVHLHQKANPYFYVGAYKKYFGMQMKHVELSPEILNQLVTNPDGYDYCWTISFYLQKGRQIVTFLPVLILDCHNNLRGMLVELKKSNRTNMLTNNGGKMIPIDSFPIYKNLYGVQTQLYHPHEIMAQLIAEHVVNNRTYNTIQLQKTNFYSDLMKILN